MMRFMISDCIKCCSVSGRDVQEAIKLAVKEGFRKTLDEFWADYRTGEIETRNIQRDIIKGC